MANISHKNLTTTQLHEPKGADAAAIDKVYVSDGAGSGTWQKITEDQLTQTGNPFGANLSHFRYQQTAGTNGGAATTSAWTLYPLATTVTNEITSCSLASSQISLPAGTYFVDATVILYRSGNCKIRLRNVTDGSTALVGQTGQSDSGANDAPVTSRMQGRVTIAGTKVFELQYWCTGNSGTVTLGTNDTGTSGEIEVYGDILIFGVA